MQKEEHDLHVQIPDAAGYSLPSGGLIGQYRVIRPLGRGGMGEVYEVEHRVLRKRYAVKVLPAHLALRENAIERFRREAEIMARLEHPRIVKVDDFGDTNPLVSGELTRYWLRMELVAGVEASEVGLVALQGQHRLVTLQELADAAGGRIEPALWARIMRQILDALSCAHAHGVVHRDLKPSNILLLSSTDAEAPLSVKVSDFGLARLVGEDWFQSQAELSVQLSLSAGDMPTAAGPQAALTAGASTRALLGTYEYMSPEQRAGKPVDARSDFFSLGVIAYRMLTGRQLMGRARAVSQLVPGTAKQWDQMIDRCLEEDPADRPASAKELLDQLVRIPVAEKRLQFAAKSRSEPSSPSASLAKGFAPRMGWFWAALGAAGLLAAGIYWRHGHTNGVDAPPEPAALAESTRPLLVPKTNAEPSVLPPAVEPPVQDPAVAAAEAEKKRAEELRAKAVQDWENEPRPSAEDAAFVPEKMAALSNCLAQVGGSASTVATASYREAIEIARSACTEGQSRRVKAVKVMGDSRVLLDELPARYYRDSFTNRAAILLRDLEAIPSGFLHAGLRPDDLAKKLNETLASMPVRPPMGAVTNLLLPGNVRMPMAWIPAKDQLPPSALRKPNYDANRWVDPVGGFWMSLHEVSREEWHAVMGSWPAAKSSSVRKPANGVFFPEAQKFISTLQRCVFPGRVALPSDEQWVWACWLGVDWGTPDLDATASYAGNNQGAPRDVGSHRHANAWGGADMLGNVWEWTASGKVMGGGYDSPTNDCHCEAQRSHTSADPSNNQGLRVVWQPDYDQTSR